jgi:hypothetical protein
MIAAIVLCFVGFIAIPIGVGRRQRHLTGFLRAQRFLATGATAPIRASKDLLRMEVRAVAADDGASCRGTVVEALIEDVWVECFSDWHGSLTVEDGTRRRATVALEHMTLLMETSEAGTTVLPELPKHLKEAARRHHVDLKEEPLAFAQRWRTRVCEIQPGEKLWVLAAVKRARAKTETRGYRSDRAAWTIEPWGGARRPRES